MWCSHYLNFHVYCTFSYSCVCLRLWIDRPTAVKFTGHLDQCSLLLVVLFRKLQHEKRQRERERVRRWQQQHQSSCQRASFTTSVLRHRCLAEWVRLCVWQHLAVRHLCDLLQLCHTHGVIFQSLVLVIELYQTLFGFRFECWNHKSTEKLKLQKWLQLNGSKV